MLRVRSTVYHAAFRVRLPSLGIFAELLPVAARAGALFFFMAE